jgi:transcriptional regulator with XRE-family HTH domain
MKSNVVNEHVGKRIRSRRTFMGMSQSDLAKAVGITFQQVQKYECGGNALSSARLLQFGQKLGVPVAYFFEELPAAARIVGVADKLKKFHHNVADVSEREVLETMKAFRSIEDPKLRKPIADLVRAIVKNQELGLRKSPPHSRRSRGG